MKQPQHISELIIQLAADKNQDISKVLRQCPFIQAELLKRGVISLDDLTDEQINTLINQD